MAAYGTGMYEYLAKMAPIVEKEIEKTMPKNKKPAEVYGLLWEMLERGGKRFRPALCLLCCEAVGGKPRKVLPAAAAIELFHTLTLIHDDIEDSSLLRRGEPCLHIKYGIPLAINAGDGLFMMTWSALLGLKMPPKKILEIQKMLMEAFSRLMEGQGLELSWHRNENWNISERKYTQMVSGKTGALIGAACKVGAYVGGGSRRQIKRLDDFGNNIGVAFQIQDDILNLTGEEEKYKKEIGGDITEGKRTLMVIHALKKGRAGERKRLREILEKHAHGRKELDTAISIMRRCGSIERAQRYAKRLAKKAKKDLGVLKKSQAKDKLVELADFLVEREV